MEPVVIDLGCGNTASVMFALERLGSRPQLSSARTVIADADRLILPGVAAAGFAMQRMHELALARVLREFERPLLGLCLGQQLLFDSSEEGDVCCLGLIGGRVRKLDPAPGRPVPHMGWNRLGVRREDPLLDGIADGAFVYFAHSYFCPTSEGTLASAEYGNEFAAAVRRGNFWGCQFHPERSSTAGARILANFLALSC
jgi:imidazole glycerol-phosphate synthase subunit HisH